MKIKNKSSMNIVDLPSMQRDIRYNHPVCNNRPDLDFCQTGFFYNYSQLKLQSITHN